MEDLKVLSKTGYYCLFTLKDYPKNIAYVFVLLLLIVCLVLLFLLWKQWKKTKNDLRQTEANLRQKEAELFEVTTAYESDRAHISESLLNRFGRLISVLEINLSQLKQTSADSKEKFLEVYKNAGSVIHEMNEELSWVSFDLMPQSLTKRGLVSALKELSNRLAIEDKVSCQVEVYDNNTRLPGLIELALFRITQEWTKDRSKYSDAKEIVIHLRHENGVFELQIDDNGRGINPNDFLLGTGKEWRSMQVRLNQIEGKLSLMSEPNLNGASLKITVEISSRGNFSGGVD